MFETTNASVQIGPNFPTSDFNVLSNSFVGRLVTGNGSRTFNSISASALIPFAPSVMAQQVASVLLPTTSNFTYVAASGWQPFLSFVIPAGLLQIVSGRPTRSLRVSTFVKSLVSVYQLRVTITQGTNVVSFMLYTAAAGSYRGPIDLIIQNVTTAAGGITGTANISMADGTSLGDVALSTSAFDPTLDMTISIDGSSADADPFTLYGVPIFSYV